jgi:hypothetical protein
MPRSVLMSGILEDRDALRQSSINKVRDSVMAGLSNFRMLYRPNRKG